MATSFENSLSEFREFLRKTNYPEKIAWVEPGDVLLSGRRLLYVHIPVPDAKPQRVRHLFELSQSSSTGILFEALCAIEETTYTFAWIPKDADEAQRRLMGRGLKVSAKTGISKVPGKAIGSRLWWTYLQWALRGRQQNKNQLFC